MFTWFCCTPAGESSVSSVDVDTSEVAAVCTSDEPLVMARPTLLAARPTLAIEPLKSRDVEEEAEADGSVKLNTTGTTWGRRCMLVSASTGAQTEAEYIVNADSYQLEVKMAGQASELGTVVFPCMSIEDIYTIEDGEDCFPKGITESLTLEEKARLFMIVCKTSAAAVCLCLIEASKSDRDDLLQQLQDLSEGCR
mmetsp:Transcript_132952/g.343966  ORF Transcript_132952/g.343966 Transcript_132952/m.343966 type:complete len:196 (-) Transcript_132952:219-806(-)